MCSCFLGTVLPAAGPRGALLRAQPSLWEQLDQTAAFTSCWLCLFARRVLVFSSERVHTGTGVLLPVRGSRRDGYVQRCLKPPQRGCVTLGSHRWQLLLLVWLAWCWGNISGAPGLQPRAWRRAEILRTGVTLRHVHPPRGLGIVRAFFLLFVLALTIKREKKLQGKFLPGTEETLVLL